MVRRMFSVVVALTVLWTAPADAQGVATGQISGTVLDTSGGVLPGVEVKATQTGTGSIRFVISGERRRVRTDEPSGRPLHA